MTAQQEKTMAQQDVSAPQGEIGHDDSIIEALLAPLPDKVVEMETDLAEISIDDGTKTDLPKITDGNNGAEKERTVESKSVGKPTSAPAASSQPPNRARGNDGRDKGTSSKTSAQGKRPANSPSPHEHSSKEPSSQVPVQSWGPSDIGKQDKQPPWTAPSNVSHLTPKSDSSGKDQAEGNIKRQPGIPQQEQTSSVPEVPSSSEHPSIVSRGKGNFAKKEQEQPVTREGFAFDYSPGKPMDFRRKWDIAGLACGIATFAVELIPLIGTFIAIPVSFIAMTICGVAIAYDREAGKIEKYPVIGFIIALIVLFYAGMKIGLAAKGIHDLFLGIAGFFGF